MRINNLIPENTEEFGGEQHPSEEISTSNARNNRCCVYNGKLSEGFLFPTLYVRDGHNSRKEITDDITTDDATVVLYHDGSTTSTLTFVFLLLARQSPNQFGLCSCFVRRFFVSVVTGTAYPNIKCCRVLYHHSAGAHLQRTGETIAPSAFNCYMAASTSLRSRPMSSAILPALRG